MSNTVVTSTEGILRTSNRAHAHEIADRLANVAIPFTLGYSDPLEGGTFEFNLDPEDFSDLMGEDGTLEQFLNG